MLRHFVLTRIGLGVTNHEWFEETVALLEAVTCASLANQTSQDFTWCLVADVGMPAPARTRLEAVLAAHPNFHLVPTDVTRMTHMQLGGHDWIYEPCRNYMLEHALVTDPLDYIITSVIDADDAWHRDFVATVNAHFAARVPELMAHEQRRGPHLQHSAGAVATFPQGLQWFAASNALEPMTFPFHSTSISVAARFSSGVSALSCRHALWPAQCA
ncbi:MAG: glycosyltransferase, partial [Candidatus Rokuibacteriota bacterium]